MRADYSCYPLHLPGLFPMDKAGFELLLLFIQLFVLYPVIHKSATELFRLIYVLTHSKDISFACIAVLLLPGTIVHEISHFFAATVLLLPVGEVQIMPEWHDNQIRLGKVTYAKTDAIRSVLVGIAPIFGAFLVLTFAYLFHLFPASNIWLTVLGGYLLYSITANMFSSKQDLVDLIYVIPFIIILGILWYLTGMKMPFHLPVELLTRMASILQFINFCITISLAVHLCIIVFIRSWMFFLKK